MKLIIDIPNYKLDEVQNGSIASGEILKAVRNGTPYNPTGDLISREALIKWIDDSVSQYGNTYSTDMLNMWGLFKDYLINNASTVCGNNPKWCESCVSKGKCASTRPQDEWLYDSDHATLASGGWD